MTMFSHTRFLITLFAMTCACLALSAQAVDKVADQQVAAEQVKRAAEDLQKPLYTPFLERYVLDELKQLRVDQARSKQELMQQILDREHNSVDRGVQYATSTVTYFFYLIAAATSLLVLVGWSSMREIKERAASHEDADITRLSQK